MPTPPTQTHTPTTRRAAHGAAVVAGVAALLTLIGCATTEDLAPSVTDVYASHLAPGVDLAVVEHGRRIYLGQCISCHAPEGIHDYTHDEWLVILPDMIEETELNPTQGEAVTQYVMTTLRIGPIERVK